MAANFKVVAMVIMFLSTFGRSCHSHFKIKFREARRSLVRVSTSKAILLVLFKSPECKWPKFDESSDQQSVISNFSLVLFELSHTKDVSDLLKRWCQVSNWSLGC